MSEDEETQPEVVEGDAAASSSSAQVDVNVQPATDTDPPAQPGFDQTVSDNLIAMLIVQAQQDLALNMATARNLVANAGAALTLGVQQVNAATMIQLFKMSPVEAQALGLLSPTNPSQN